MSYTLSSKVMCEIIGIVKKIKSTNDCEEANIEAATLEGLIAFSMFKSQQPSEVDKSDVVEVFPDLSSKPSKGINRSKLLKSIGRGDGYTAEELRSFCRKYGINSTGVKQDLVNRLANEVF